MSFARQGIITPEMKFVANKENIDPEQIKEKKKQRRGVLFFFKKKN